MQSFDTHDVRNIGRAETLDLARLANLHGPQLHKFDRQGNRIDEVEFHPAWHSLMALKWLPKILSHQYDPRSLPIAQKSGALIGMGMTEKQGGSDVRTNSTHAAPLPPSEARALFGDDGEEVFRIVGHKWFFSAPQSDAHLILAQTDNEGSAGLSCLLLPRYLPNGERNAIRVQRLKDKVGNRSNASAEVEFTGAYGWLIGKPGRGIPTILEMGSHTRLDCVLGSAGARATPCAPTCRLWPAAVGRGLRGDSGAGIGGIGRGTSIMWHITI